MHDVFEQRVLRHGKQVHRNGHAAFDQLSHVFGLIPEQRKPKDRDTGVHGFVQSGYAPVAYEQLHFGVHCKQTTPAAVSLHNNYNALQLCRVTEYLALGQPLFRHHVCRFVFDVAFVFP